MYDMIIERDGLRSEDAANLKAAFGASGALCRPGSVRLEALSRSSADFLRAGIGDVPPAEVLPVPSGLSVADIRLMAFDMESTLIENECLDDLTELAGSGNLGRELTRHGLSGDIGLGFADSLAARVRLLEGAPASLVDNVLERIRLTAGAEDLMSFCRDNGILTYIITSSFTPIAAHVADRLGMTGFVANELEIRDGKITGLVTGPAGGRLLDAAGKRRTLEILCAAHGVRMKETLTCGYGMNDVDMVKAAHIGVAFHGTPALAQTADLRIRRGGLDTVKRLFIEGWDDAARL